MTSIRVLVTASFLFLNSIVWAQKSRVLDRLSFKGAYSLSLNQYGVSPFSSTRDMRRGISAVLLNLQYAQPIGKNLSVNIGIQTVDKGTRFLQIVDIPNYKHLRIEYEQVLHCLELPISATRYFCNNKWGITVGIAPSYLISNDFRYSSEEIEYNSSGNVAYSYTSTGATNPSNDRYTTLNVDAMVGFSRQLIPSIALEMGAQKQLLYSNSLFKKNHDIAYLLTMSVGLRITL